MSANGSTSHSSARLLAHYRKLKDSVVQDDADTSTKVPVVVDDWSPENSPKVGEEDVASSSAGFEDAGEKEIGDGAEEDEVGHGAEDETVGVASSINKSKRGVRSRGPR